MSEEKILEFPADFLWGAATSAHQVEGNNHNNWTDWEKANANRLALEARNKWQKWQQEKFPEMFEPQNYISGRACDHFNRFEEDLEIAKSLGHNAHRFSLEWSRIEPEEGKFNGDAIEHYQKVIRALHERNLEPFITLCHWTTPLWLRDLGGIENKKFPFYFCRFVKYVMRKLKDNVRLWMTLNEPTTLINNSYLQGKWPPQKKSIISVFKVFRNLARAHKEAYKVIHQINPTALVGFGNLLMHIEPYDNRITNKLSAWLYDFWLNRYFLYLTGKTHDYYTIQYYFHLKIRFPDKIESQNKSISDLGWEIYPQGIYHLIKRFKKHKKPIYITENGLADADDNKREKFIKEHLYWIHKAIQEGVDVRGYFYWSLLDNFEWDKGFWPRFGLVEVDYQTLTRKIRPSAYEYKKICQSNKLDLSTFS